MKDVTARGGRVLGSALAAIVLGLVAASAATAADPVKIALVAALSGQSAKSGEGITRGLTIAIDEIIARGGVLGGRRVELIRRDGEANPANGPRDALEVSVQRTS